VADAIPIVLIGLALLLILMAGVSALQLLERVLAKARAPWWVLYVLLLVMVLVLRLVKP
jgi:FtsH-binding integral membrane protein